MVAGKDGEPLMAPPTPPATADPVAAPTTTALSAAAHAESLASYIQAGTEGADTLGNRGPIRFNDRGELAEDILQAYWRTGFYVFEGLVASPEIALLQAEMEQLLDQAPVDNGALVDAKGRPAFGQQFARNPYTMTRPLSDPWGGTTLLGGRHQVQMNQPVAAASAPKKVVFLMHGMCQTMASGLRLYGHPQLLQIADSINGADFVPYNDATFVKQPGLGSSVAWHQDGVTHWDSPNWDEGIHGFNFQVQLYATTPHSCLWVMPGTHKLGKINIKKLVAENGGSEQLPGAVPLYCNPGDVTIVNRQALHCSFPNTSPDMRVSLTFGFHRRSSVLGAQGALSQTALEVYDAQRIAERAAVIAVAIDARAQFYPAEPPYSYQPFADLVDEYRFSAATWDTVIKDYNLKDLSI
jgi:hypothetical protein